MRVLECQNKLGELGAVSFGILKLGDVSFRISKLGNASFRMSK